MISCKQRGSCGERRRHCGDDGDFSDTHGGGDDLLTEFGDVVLEGAADFLEQAMLPESTNGSGQLCACPVRQLFAELPVGDPANEVLAAHDSEDQVEIGREEEVDAAIGSASVILNRTADAIQVATTGRVVFQGREEIQVAAIGRGEDFPDRTQAVDSFLDRRIFHFRAAIPVYHLTVVFKERDVIGRRLDAQDMAELVVHLNGSGPQAVAQPGTFDQDVIAGSPFSFEERAEAIAPGEGGDIIGLDLLDGAACERRVKRRQVIGTAEDEVGGIFDLQETPMPTRGKHILDGADLAGPAIQALVEDKRIEIVGQCLGAGEIFHGDEGVVLLGKVDLLAAQSAGQPVVAIAVELKPERSPGGHAQVAQAQKFVDEVEVEVGTPSSGGLQVGAAGRSIMPRLEATAILHGREDMHQARMGAPLLQDGGNPVLLPESLGTADGFHLYAFRFRQCLRIRVQTVAQRIDQRGVVEEHDLAFQELGLHGVDMAAVRQAAGDDNAVETSQNSDDPVLVPFRQKGVAHAA